jgi:hypothetical protein
MVHVIIMIFSAYSQPIQHTELNPFRPSVPPIGPNTMENAKEPEDRSPVYAYNLNHDAFQTFQKFQTL